jgi:hypothetical protein
VITFVLWKWQQPNFRDRYTAEFVNIVSAMVRKHMLGIAYRIVCVTDDGAGIEGPTEVFPLWPDHDGLKNATGQHLPSCYRRLKLFDRPTQRAMGITEGDRIVSLDLDSIILGSLAELFDKIEKSKAVFAGWGVRGTYHQTVYNGSFWTFNAGTHLQRLWSDFDPEVSPKLCLKKSFLGSDQAWLSMNFNSRVDALAIRFPEFASYPREVRRLNRIDARTKIVFFHGSRKPWHTVEYRAQPWIQTHWR